MSKGQVFTADFVASITIFSFFILFFGVMWNNSVDTFVQDAESPQQRMENKFSLMKTEGYPQGWEEDSVSVLGVYEDEYLSLEKFSKLGSMGESKLRRLLETQEYRLSLDYLNGTKVRYQGTNMSYSSSELPANKTVYVERSYVVLEEKRKRAELNYWVWEG